MTKTNDELDESIRSLGVLIETVIDQNQAILEAVGDMQQNVAKIPPMQEDIAELKADVQLVKAAITDTSRQVNDLEERATKLEVGAA